MIQNETRGPADQVVQTVLAYADHMVHNRPGMVTPDPSNVVGVSWAPVTLRREGDESVVHCLVRQGRGSRRVRVGILADAQVVGPDGRVVGEYRPAGLFREVATWLYGQVAEVYRLDNELCARWASHSFGEAHRDLKVVLAAFMLVQTRKGDPICDGGEVVFHDEDYRDVGEAMVLLRRDDGRDLNPKLLLRVGQVLSLHAVATINRQLGFGRSGRKPFLGRWPKAVEKWLRYREENPRMLDGLVKAGFKRTVIQLCRKVGYKPITPRFFAVLGWNQTQASDGRRTVAVGERFGGADSWAGLTEEQICLRIVAERPSYKRLVGLVPPEVGVTRAVMAAAVEAGCLSNKDLIIAVPTLEALGLLGDPAVSTRVEAAMKTAEDQRAANVARRVRSVEVREQLADAADGAVQRAVAEVTRGLRIYFFVDISASMHDAIDQAKGYLERFLQGFPLERLHVAVFNTAGRPIAIKHASGAGVRQAFLGLTAGGGTDYGAGVRALAGRPPAQDEDSLFVFIGDEEAGGFAPAVTASGLRPLAFGLVRLRNSRSTCVQDTAAQLGIPCFRIDERTFEDPYAIPRTVRALVEATPVGVVSGAQRVGLIDRIIDTELLQKPVWAA